MWLYELFCHSGHSSVGSSYFSFPSFSCCRERLTEALFLMRETHFDSDTWFLQMLSKSAILPVSLSTPFTFIPAFRHIKAKKLKAWKINYSDSLMLNEDAVWAWHTKRKFVYHCICDLWPLIMHVNFVETFFIWRLINTL